MSRPSAAETAEMRRLWGLASPMQRLALTVLAYLLVEGDAE